MTYIQKYIYIDIYIDVLHTHYKIEIYFYVHLSTHSSLSESTSSKFIESGKGFGASSGLPSAFMI